MPLNIFLSWSGDKSRIVASTLRDWLPLVFHDKVSPWISTHDIDAGDRGDNAIASQLHQCQFGIVCLSKDNLDSSWINFEAGAISKSVSESHLCTYLIDLTISDIKPPLSRFQANKADHDGTRRIVESINKDLGTSALNLDLLSKTFDITFPSLEKQLEEAHASKPGLRSSRSEKDILEELVTLVRSGNKPDNRLLEEEIKVMSQRLALMSERPSAVRYVASHELKEMLVEHLLWGGLQFSADALANSDLSLSDDELTVYTTRTFSLALRDPVFKKAVEARLRQPIRLKVVVLEKSGRGLSENTVERLRVSKKDVPVGPA
jgi:hypothetical protein